MLNVCTFVYVRTRNAPPLSLHNSRSNKFPITHIGHNFIPAAARGKINAPQSARRASMIRIISPDKRAPRLSFHSNANGFFLIAVGGGELSM
jgi:hypothetical protein